MQTVYLDPALVPPQLRAGYTGKSFQAKACTEMTIPSDAGIWYSGSRSSYEIMRLADGKRIEPVNHNAAPWDKERKDYPVKIEQGVIVVQHSMFAGKDMGLTYYIHPSDVVPMLPKEEVLSLPQRQVLYVHGAIKSAFRIKEFGYNRFDMSQYETTKAWLIEHGYLDKRGAITVKGKNTRGNSFNYPKE